MQKKINFAFLHAVLTDFQLRIKPVELQIKSNQIKSNQIYFSVAGETTHNIEVYI